jgi:tRNA(Arg) A34 adenosine deaminase TadA/CheY-like chemotaxis protein
MSYSNNLTILIADGNEVNRRYMANLLRTHGYKVLQAIDGGTAMKVVDENAVDAAIVDHHMTPRTGFEFAKHVLVKGYDIGIIMVTDDPSTDLLLEAGRHEIKQIMRKPLDPDRLAETVRRVLRAHGKNPDALGGGQETVFTPDQLMQRAIALAQQNALSHMGGPFGAVVASPEGHLLGEGVNSVAGRSDPTAHAEVMAIRRATERLGTVRLDGCTVYCSSEPTMLGQALIISTGVAKVYYGLSHEEAGVVRATEDGILGEISKPLASRAVPYQQLLHDEALKMFQDWQGRAARRATD